MDGEGEVGGWREREREREKEKEREREREREREVRGVRGRREKRERGKEERKEREGKRRVKRKMAIPSLFMNHTSFASPKKYLLFSSTEIQMVKREKKREGIGAEEIKRRGRKRNLF
jgi:hypothetical protein